MVGSIKDLERADPILSVVVASNNASRSICECLDALTNQTTNGPVEIIVVDYSTDGTTEFIESKFPHLKLIKFSEPRLIPALWSHGISHCRGNLVALTTAHCVPDKHWIAQILKAHETSYPAIGGAIENCEPASLVDWAIYFCRYTHYMKPFPAGFVEDLPGDNASYKMRALESCQDVWQNGFWESFVHARLCQEGKKLLLTPEITVFHKQSYNLGAFMRQRFYHGRNFGRLRGCQFPALKKVGLIVGSPAIPLLLLMRIGRGVLQKKRHGDKLFLSLPLLLLFLISWSVGELIGYLQNKDFL